MLNVNVKTDYAKVPAASEAILRVMVSLQAPKAQEQTRGKPLSLALVLDRSGSMAGDKIRNVRQATQTLFEMMDPEDVFSLVAYDDKVEEVVAPVKVSKARGVEARIANIDSRGMTNLSGGYELGCLLAGKAGVEDYTTRVILLSDGLANQGETRSEALAQMAARILAKGITTTTIGVGRDYNEDLMGRMAEHGGGGAHFIERPEHARSVFEEELGCLKALAASKVRVEFRPGAGVTGFEQLNSYRVLEPGAFLVGDAYQGQRKCLLLEVRVNAPTAGVVPLGEVRVFWHSAAGEGFEDGEAVVPVSVEAVPAGAYRAEEPDRDITLEAAFLVVARVKREAIALADQGEFDRAAELLEQCAAGLERLRLDDLQLAEEIADLRDRARRLRHERDEFYDVMERKRMFHEFDKGSKGSMASMRRMRERSRDGGG